MNKKGFTLIELLAVIVILAIIAIIATPIILNVIDTAKKGAKESSTLGYIDAVEKQVMMSQVDTSATNISAGTYSVAQLTALKVDVKGEKPVDTSVLIIGTKGEVTEGWFTYPDSEYKIYYDGKNAVADTSDYLDSKGNKHNTIPEAGTSTVKTYIVGEAVYLDPTNLSTTCDASNSVSTTGTKTGCMKWYVIKDNGNSIDVLLDHNTTATVAWVSKADYNDDTNWGSIGNNNKGPITANKQLTTDTTGWTSGLNPRLITANEIAAITGNTTFDGSSSTWFFLDSNNQTQTATTQGASSYAWLFDYTKNCTSYGCNTADSSTYGYWTSSPASDFSECAWYVTCYGGLRDNPVDHTPYHGVRPVISVPKSQIS